MQKLLKKLQFEKTKNLRRFGVGGNAVLLGGSSTTLVHLQMDGDLSSFTAGVRALSTLYRKNIENKKWLNLKNNFGGKHDFNCTIYFRRISRKYR